MLNQAQWQWLQLVVAKNLFDMLFYYSQSNLVHFFIFCKSTHTTIQKFGTLIIFFKQCFFRASNQAF